MLCIQTLMLFFALINLYLVVPHPLPVSAPYVHCSKPLVHTYTADSGIGCDTAGLPRKTVSTFKFGNPSGTHTQPRHQKTHATRLPCGKRRATNIYQPHVSTLRVTGAFWPTLVAVQNFPPTPVSTPSPLDFRHLKMNT